MNNVPAPVILPSAGVLESLGFRQDPQSSATPSGGIKWCGSDIVNTIALAVVGTGLGFVAAHEIVRAARGR